MKRTTIKDVLELLESERLLLRHLSGVRTDIRAACADIAIHTPGIKTSPDAMIDVYIPIEGEAMVLLARMDYPDIRVIVEPHWRVPMSEDELEGVE